MTGAPFETQVLTTHDADWTRYLAACDLDDSEALLAHEPTGLSDTLDVATLTDSLSGHDISERFAALTEAR